MTHTFKMSRRMARFRSAVAGVMLLGIAGCSDRPEPTGLESVASVDDSSQETTPTQMSSLVSVSGIPIYPGQSIQNAVNSNPAGTKFLIKAGRHKRQSVRPKSGNTFVGEAGAILDGENATEYAFTKGYSPYPSNVRIQGLIIEKYKPPVQMGAVSAGGHGSSYNSVGWIVESCEIRYNATGGVRLGNKMQLLRNKIHHNRQIGVIMGGGDSTVVDGNEIAYNNYNWDYAWGWELGGTKFVMTRWLRVINNYAHHNNGPGLWTDTDNIYTVYENNRLEYNAGPGIMHEISYDAVIRNNTAKANGFQKGWILGAGILVAASPNVEIYGNVLSGNKMGITASQQNRGSGRYGAHLVKNLYVHDNTITQPSGRSGVARDWGDNSVYTSWNNRFRNNVYYLGSNPAPFEWMNGMRSKAQWLGYGQDLTGRFY